MMPMGGMLWPQGAGAGMQQPPMPEGQYGAPPQGGYGAAPQPIQ
jgi:hypothetical protein